MSFDSCISLYGCDFALQAKAVLVNLGLEWKCGANVFSLSGVYKQIQPKGRLICWCRL